MQRHSSQQQQRQQQHCGGKTKQVYGEESNATVTVTGTGTWTGLRQAATPSGYSFLHSTDEQRTQTKWHMHMHAYTYTNTEKHTHTHAHGSPFVCVIFPFLKQHTLTNFLPSKTVKKLKCCLTTLPLDKFAQTHKEGGRDTDTDTERCYSHFHIAVHIMPICLWRFVSKASWHI